jgi:NAD(P)-dependent dehydrogenase (short-subunit alcohol dehydrogenase family)
MLTFLAEHPSYLHSLAPMPFRAIGAPEEFMTPEDVADVVAWLAGDGSANMSGSQVVVDRGHLKH